MVQLHRVSVCVQGRAEPRFIRLILAGLNSPEVFEASCRFFQYLDLTTSHAGALPLGRGLSIASPLFQRLNWTQLQPHGATHRLCPY